MLGMNVATDGRERPVSVARAEKASLTWVFLIAAWTLIACAVASSGEFKAWWLRKGSAPALWSYDASLDPVKGSAIQLPVRDVYGRRVHEERLDGRMLIVAAGYCSDCSLKTLKPWLIASDEFARVVLVYQDSPGAISDKMRDLPENFRVVADPTGQYLRTLNPAWTPRFFLVESGGRLIDLQTDQDTIPAFVRMVEQP
ncbi:MAG: hypothetical protein IH851_02260 [Armatimonadetes bacterium]|nr:hypothetical protein [Armatimonadota bacterium]